VSGLGEEKGRVREEEGRGGESSNVNLTRLVRKN
jgi:hypothetical protein